VIGTRTLRALCDEAEVVIRARIDGRGLVAIGDEGKSRPAVEARILQILKGSVSGETIRFFQHGHGVVPFEAGDEALVFLESLHRVPELASLAGQSDVVWVSLQEQTDAYDAGEGDTALLRAVAEIVAAGKLPTRAERAEALRRATVSQLASPDPRVAGSAVRDLVAAGDQPVFRAEDLPAVEALLANPQAPIGVRIGVLSELERRGLVDAPPRWVALLRSARGRDRRAAIRAAGMRPGPEVTAVLVELMNGDDPEAASMAAVALGHPGNQAAVAPLAAALAGDDANLRRASIRGLERIGTPEAHDVLAKAAASHPDPGTRRRARAAVRVLDGASRPRGGS